MESLKKDLRFKRIQNTKEKKDFLKFYYRVYAADTAFVDTDVFILKDMLFNKTQIAKDMSIIPIAVYQQDKKICQCILFIKNELNQVFLGYFDALEHKHEEVQFLLLEAQKIAFEYRKEKIVIGINGHISCGVGILQDHFEQKATFDSRHSKKWYKDYFAHLPAKGLTTYIVEMDLLRQSSSASPTAKKITYRFFDPKNFDAEMEKFSFLCNKTLCSTDYYYEMKPYHMKNLLIGMKAFLKKEYLIFAMDGEKEVGFIFWHPDFNELFNAGKKNNLLMVFFKHIFKKMAKCKINAVGILDEYRNTQALFTLIDVFKNFAVKYKSVETTFIWDNNQMSSALASKRMKPYKHYSIYELVIDYD